MPTVNDIAEGFCNRGTARLQSGTGELRLCPQAQHWVAEFLGPKYLTRQRDRCDISPFKGRRDNLVSERDRETKVSINSAITFIKSPDLGGFCPLGCSDLQDTCDEWRTKHKSLQSRIKPFAPHYDSFPFTRLNTLKLQYLLLHTYTRDQGNPWLLSRPRWTQCGNLNQAVLRNSDKPAGVTHSHRQTWFCVELCWIRSIYINSVLFKQGIEIPTFFIWQFSLRMQFLLWLLRVPRQFTTNYCTHKFRALYSIQHLVSVHSADWCL